MKKLFALVLVMCMLWLTACGGTSASGTASSKGSSGSAAGTASGAAKDKPHAGETLTVLYMSSVYADAARAMVPKFEQETGAKVDVVDFPYVTLHEKALLDLTSGGTSAYDVVDVASQWDGEFSPFLTKLDPYISKDHYDMNVWIDNVLANCGKWQNEIIGIPNACTPQIFAYRTDLMPNGIPDTWDEYYKQAKALTGNGVYGVSIAEAPGQLGGVFDYVLWSMGGAWADENWNVTIDSPEARAALQHLYRLNKECMDPANMAWGVEESSKAFLDGKAAVCETWPTLGITQSADKPDKSKVVGKWALGVIPHEKTGVTLLSAWDVAIPSNSAHKDLAWEWVKMYTSAEQQQEFYQKYSIFSPRKDFWEQPSIKNSSLYPLRAALDTANMWWRIAASVEADTVINTEVSAYLSDQQDLEKTVANMKKGIELALKNSPPENGIKNYNR